MGEESKSWRVRAVVGLLGEYGRVGGCKTKAPKQREGKMTEGPLIVTSKKHTRKTQLIIDGEILRNILEYVSIDIRRQLQYPFVSPSFCFL